MCLVTKSFSSIISMQATHYPDVTSYKLYVVHRANYSLRNIITTIYSNASIVQTSVCLAVLQKLKIKLNRIKNIIIHYNGNSNFQSSKITTNSGTESESLPMTKATDHELAMPLPADGTKPPIL